MKPSTILSGSVERVLSYSTWNNSNVFLYLAQSREIILMRDTDPLWIFAPFDLSVPSERICGSINPISGDISCSNGCTVTVFSAVEMFGQPVRWVKAVEYKDITQCTSLQWLNLTQLCITTQTGMLEVRDFKDGSTQFSKNLGFTNAEACPFTHDVLLYTPKVSSEILVLLSFGCENRPEPSAFRINVGAYPALRASLVSSDFLVVTTKKAVYVWNCKLRTLVLSSAVQKKSPAITLPNTDGSLLIQSADECSVLRQEGDRLTIKPVDPLKLPPALEAEDTDIWVTDSRVNIVSRSEVLVYSRLASSVQYVGTIRRILSSSTPNLASGPSSIMAGNTVLSFEKSEVASLRVIDDKTSTVLLSNYGRENWLVVADTVSNTSFTLKAYRGEELKWSQTLRSLPKSIGSGTEFQGSYIVYAICADGSLEGFNLQDGEKMVSHTNCWTDVENAEIQDNFALVHYSNKVETWDLSAPERGRLSVMQFGESINAIALSERYTICIAYSASNGNCTLACREFEAMSPVSTITVPQPSIINMAWSPDSECLALLTLSGLHIYTLVSEFRGKLIELTSSDINRTYPFFTSSFSSATRISWGADSGRVFVYNGRQLLAVDIDAASDNSQVDALKALSLNSYASQPTNIKDVNRLLCSPMPIYHPDILLLTLEALQPEVTVKIVQQLLNEIRYTDVSDDGEVILLDPSLHLASTDLAGLNSAVNYSVLEVDNFHLLEKYRLPGLTREDQSVLRKIVQALTLDHQLDTFGLYAYLALITKPDQQTAAESAKTWTYSWLSETNLRLWNLLSDEFSRAKEKLPIWLKNGDLKKEVELNAKRKFAQTQDPTTVSLLYIALRNLNGLRMLWRVASGHPEKDKTLKLLKNDFTVPRWRTAAHKNAYALLSKHRPEYAAAFFLLGDSIKDCCQVCVDKLNDLELAITVARIYDGDDGEGIKFLRSRYFDLDVANAETPNTLWTRFWLDCLCADVDLEAFIAHWRMDLAIPFLYAWRGGTTQDKKQEWGDALKERGVPEILAEALLNGMRINSYESKLEPSVPDPTTQETQDPLEERPMPANLKAPPAELQLEPDMSAFGF